MRSSNYKNVFMIDGYSDVGNHRDENQDAIAFDESAGIVILADGMGGHKAGQVASKIATSTLIEEFGRYFVETTKTQDISKIQDFVRSKIFETNKIIFEKSKASDDLHGMGTTLVANCFFDNKLLIAHVGDSRAYLFRNNVLLQLTRDHSFVQFQLDNGLITEEEFQNSKQKNYLTRALGLEDFLDVEFNVIDVLPNDLILNCSDGFTEKLDHYQIEESLNNFFSFDSPALALVEKAKSAGSSDNISVVIVRILEDFKHNQPSFLRRLLSYFNK